MKSAPRWGAFHRCMLRPTETSPLQIGNLFPPRGSRQNARRLHTFSEKVSAQLLVWRRWRCRNLSELGRVRYRGRNRQRSTRHDRSPANALLFRARSSPLAISRSTVTASLCEAQRACRRLGILPDSAGGLPAHPGRSPGKMPGGPRQPGRLSSDRGALFFPKRMDNKRDHRNGDARIGDVKRRPGMLVGNVHIEKEKIDHVPIKKTIGKIPQDDGKQKRKRRVAPNIAWPPLHEKSQNNEKRDS